MISEIAFASQNREEYLENQKGVDRNWSILIDHFLNCKSRFDFIEELFREGVKIADIRLPDSV